jgi:hypothetical protein
MNRPDHLPAVPDAERYKRALRSMEITRQLKPKDKAMLVEHFRSPDRCVTAAELAEKVGYPDGNTINLRYGLFAQSVADRMLWVVPDGCQSSYTVAWFEKPDEREEHWRWHMHPEVAAALAALGW